MANQSAINSTGATPFQFKPLAPGTSPFQFKPLAPGATPYKIKIPEKSTGLIGKAFGTTPPPQKKTYDMSQYGMSKVPTPIKPVTTPIIANTKATQNNFAGSLNENGGGGASTTSDQTSTSTNTMDNTKKPTNNNIQNKNTDTTYKGLIERLSNQNKSNYNKLAESNIGLIGDAARRNEQYAINARDIANAAGQRISDIGGQGARGQAGYLTTGTSPVGEGNAAVLAQTTAAQQRAVTEGANMQLAGNAQGLTAQQQQQAGYTSAAGQALSGQGIQQSALGTAAGYMQPTSNIILRDPTTGEVIGNQNLESLAATQGRLSGIQSGASSAASALGGSQAALTQAYQEGKAQLRAANNIEPQIVQTINSNNLNSTQISALTNLNQWFSGQTSQPEQQALSKQVASYIAALGMSPEEATQIAIQEGGTIGTLLTTLKNLAIAKNEANNPANINVPGASNTTSSPGVIEFNSNGTLKALSF